MLADSPDAAVTDDAAPYLRYGSALNEGFPIATGIIDGACGHLVKGRLDITGARWAWRAPKPS